MDACILCKILIDANPVSCADLDIPGKSKQHSQQSDIGVVFASVPRWQIRQQLFPDGRPCRLVEKQQTGTGASTDYEDRTWKCECARNIELTAPDEELDGVR